MSESDQIDIDSLHRTVLRETENDSLLEIKPNFYRSLSDFIGNLRKQEFDGVENKIKDTMIEMATELTSLLIHIRLEKISNSDDYEISHLLDEEKFILDSQEEQNERTEMILSATINGKSKFLELLAENHKIKKVVIRFLSEVDEIVGADLEKYGPFKAEDIATIPYENAQALIAKKIATKVRWED
ncbi:MAG: DNA replication complex GINS family protein [Candidatus Nitrosopelagicus sp.]|jgi:DNA replication factor GINS|nr:DNA replication complex GINS family protein [Candidatus Nitrosopelagicus sp.]|tara:strand:+ start:3357 stop:3914 length:558 start_codon:yes stop_codon:yes gene_type:complete